MAGPGLEARALLKFLEDPTFAEGFGGKVVWWQIGIFGMTGKAAKILFLENQGSKIVSTCMDLSIGGRAWHGSKNTFAIPWRFDFCGRFWLGGSYTKQISLCSLQLERFQIPKYDFKVCILVHTFWMARCNLSIYEFESLCLGMIQLIFRSFTNHWAGSRGERIMFGCAALKTSAFARFH